jgi:hypothetical protein
MSSHAIMFHDDGTNSVVCPAADVRMAEDAAAANEVLQDYRDARTDGIKYYCFDCFSAHSVKSEVLPKLGDVVSPHFSHIKDKYDKDAHAAAKKKSGGVTEQHRLGVAEVVRLLRQQPATLDVAEEVISKSEDVNLRPDIVQIMDDGSRHAFEVQYSDIQVERLKARTEGMFRFGYASVTWYLFQKAYTDAVRFFLHDRENASFFWMQAQENPIGSHCAPIIKIAVGTVPKDKADPKSIKSGCKYSISKKQSEIIDRVAANFSHPPAASAPTVEIPPPNHPSGLSSAQRAIIREYSAPKTAQVNTPKSGMGEGFYHGMMLSAIGETKDGLVVVPLPEVNGRISYLGLFNREHVDFLGEEEASA